MLIGRIEEYWQKHSGRNLKEGKALGLSISTAVADERRDFIS